MTNMVQWFKVSIAVILAIKAKLLAKPCQTQGSVPNKYDTNK